jgi:Tfp pilus assembly protein PilV
MSPISGTPQGSLTLKRGTVRAESIQEGLLQGRSMSRRQSLHRIRARLDGERGFTILETVIALMVVFASLTALAYTASNGFRYIGYGRDRIQATGIANRIMEDIRGLAYTKITSGIPSTELTTDARIKPCAGIYRFESCSGEKVVSSTFAAGYTAAWLVPHTGTMTVGNLDITYGTYVTNDSPTTTPYRVTVIIRWSNGAIAGGPNNSVRLQSLFWSPSGCVNPATHPFAAPCQPFFYGQAEVPQARLDVTGQIHDFSVDFDSFTLTLPGLTAETQEEQTKQLNATTTLSGLQFIDSSNTTTLGNQEATSDADDEVETSTATKTGGNSTNVAPLSHSHLNSDAPLQIGLIASVPAGDQEHRSTTVAATGADAYACPTTGVREVDSLSCAGGHVREIGTTTVSIPVTHVTGTVGAANLIRVVGPATDTTAKIDRDASSGTSEDGLIDVQATRTLGTVQLGGFPASGMTAPVGMSTTQTLDTNYCVRLVGYSDTAHAIAGERQATNPSATISAGTFFYYNGLGFSNKVATDSTLDTLTVTCSKTQLVGLSTVTWRVTVASGRVKHATTTTAQTADPADVQTRWDAEATAHPIEITIRYEYIVDGVHQIDVVAAFDPGDLFAHGIYQAPPAAQS